MLDEIKAQTRQALHDAMAVSASYSFKTDPTVPTQDQIDAGLSLTVRWHNKIRIVGENEQMDAGVLEGINRLVFNAPQLADLGLTLKRYAVVTIPAYQKSFRLDYEGDPDGPSNVYWSVVEIDFAGTL